MAVHAVEVGDHVEGTFGRQGPGTMLDRQIGHLVNIQVECVRLTREEAMQWLAHTPVERPPRGAGDLRSVVRKACASRSAELLAEDIGIASAVVSEFLPCVIAPTRVLEKISRWAKTRAGGDRSGRGERGE